MGNRNILFFIFISIIAILLRFIYFHWSLLSGHCCGQYFELDREEILKILKGELVYLGRGIFPFQSEGKIPRLLPLYFYLLALSHLLSLDVEKALFFNTLLITIPLLFLTYRFCTRFLNEKVAYVSTIFTAVSPMLIMWSSIITNPMYVPLFTIGFFYSVFLWIFINPKYISLVMVFLVSLISLHLTTTTFILLLTIIFYLFRPKILFRYFAIGLFFSTLLTLPFFLYEFTHNFENLKLMISGFFHGDQQSYFRPFDIMYELVFQGTTFAGKGETYIPKSYFDLSTHLWNFSQFSITILSFIGLGAIILKIKTSKKIIRKKYLIFLLWFFIPTITFFSIPFVYFLAYYFLLLYPLIPILAAISFLYFYKLLKTKRLWKYPN